MLRSEPAGLIRNGSSPYKLFGSANTARPGLAAMLDYARAGEHRIMLRALREGFDTTTPTGRAVLAIMATLAELELEPGCERRAQSRESRRARSMPATQPYKLSPDRHEQLRRLAVTKLGNRTGNLGNRSAQPVDSQTPRLTGTTPIRQIDT